MTQFLRAEILIDPRLVTPERLQELLLLLSDTHPILEEIGGIIEEGIADWFDSQGQGTWAPLKASTLRDKAYRGYGGENPLVRTGRLRDAITQPDGPGHKFLVDQNSVDVGFYPDMVPYAAYLMNGTRYMPARVLVQVGPDVQNQIVQALRTWLGSDGVRVTVNAYSGDT